MYAAKLKISDDQFHFQFLDTVFDYIINVRSLKINSDRYGIHILVEFDHEKLNAHNARISSFVSSK